MTLARLRGWLVLWVIAACGCGGDHAEPIGPATAETAADLDAEPPQPAGHRQMVRRLRDIAARTIDEHHYQGTARVRKLRRELDRLGERAPWRLYLDAGQAELEAGNEREGIELLTFAHQRLGNGTMPGGPAALIDVSFALGVGYLRLAETENCCKSPVATSCILPIDPAARHRNPEGSEQAAKHFTEVLDALIENSYQHLSARWLLNLAHLTLGTYPAAIPEHYRIPAAAVEPNEPFARFENVAAELGMDTFSLSGGVIVDDFDGDDYLDVLTSSWNTQSSLRLFRNNADGTFTDRTRAAGLAGLLGGLNLVQADYDNDGHLDFLVLRGAWLFEHGRHPNSLVRNNGDGTFTDVTFAAGLAQSDFPSQTADWADFDNDGDLDLFIGNESSNRLRAPPQLFRNEGDGTFEEIAAQARIDRAGFTKGVAWGDYDDDRFPDLYVSNNGAPNQLYHNNGDGTFTDVATTLGVEGPDASFPVWFWDYDNDGVLDLYVPCYGTGIGHIAGYHLGLTQDHQKARLYRGNGAGGFEDVAERVGLTYPAMPMGSNFGDIDNDGYLDFYLGTGNVFYHSVMPNLLYHNEGGKRFRDVTIAAGVGHLQKGHGVAFADLDNDGDLDVFEQIGGAFRGDGFHDALFENPGFDNHWITVHLVGTESNRSAIGARIEVRVQEAGMTRTIYRHVSSGGSFGANPLRQTIGLGDADRIESMAVFWPCTGKTQRIADAPVDRLIRIVESRDGFAEPAVSRLRLGTR